jgi:hypothetical protein
MSSLLEQAIIDAAALKDAAIKNAESALLDKYSNDIREAVENLLEQEEEVGAEAEAETVSGDIPLAAAPEDEVSDEEMITLDMDELQKMADTLAAEDESLMGEPVSHEAAAEETLTPPAEVSDEIAPVDVAVALEEEIDTVDLEAIIEELIVDIEPQKEGWVGTPDDIMDFKQELEMARMASTKAQEENEALIAANKKLTKENKDLKTKFSTLIDSVNTLKESMEKVNLSNARLVYTNKTLTNRSLNERQKEKIVDALSEARSVEEAKVIFETLENAVGSVVGKAQPQSLRETIERPSANLPRRADRTVERPAMDRMQILAGIKSHK